MTGTDSPTTPPAGRGRTMAMLERYGAVAVGVIFALFVIEMVVIVLLLRVGVDFDPFLVWISETSGVDVGGVAEAAGTLGVAYAITRLLKPFQIAVALILTPPIAGFVARWQGEPSHPASPPSE